MPASPLAGRAVVIFRSEERADELRQRLEREGARVQAIPVIRHVAAARDEDIAALLAHPERYDWIAFTSANAVRFFLAACAAQGAGAEVWRRARIAAVGEATASAATAAGLPPRWTAAGSGTALAARLTAELMGGGGRVLLPQSRLARPETRAALEAAGIAVDAVVVYDTLPAAASELGRWRAAWELGELPDVCILASPSAVEALVALLGEEGKGCLSRPHVSLVAIGPTTAAAVRGAGLHVAAEAETPTAEGLAKAAIAAMERRQGKAWQGEEGEARGEG